MKIITTLNEYQDATDRTDNHTDNIKAVINFGLGIAGESGEIVDLVKKVIYHGHVADQEKFKAELGDLMWYIARLADRLGLTLEEVANYNIEKLQKRYPDGFSQQKSINRVESK